MRDEEFTEFFQATWPRLFRTTYAVAAADRAAAEDALSAAYVKAYASWDRVRSTAHPEAYVRRIAINEVLGVRRRAWWRAERTPLPTDRGDRLAVPSHESATVDRESLWRAVRALPPRQRAVIVLRYYEDLSEEEIADALRCSRGTVKSQAFDALRRLRLREDLGPESRPDVVGGASR